MHLGYSIYLPYDLGKQGKTKQNWIYKFWEYKDGD